MPRFVKLNYLESEPTIFRRRWQKFPRNVCIFYQIIWRDTFPNYLLITDLLTYSMMQSPSSEANQL